MSESSTDRVQHRITRYWDARADSYAIFQSERAAEPSYAQAWARAWSAVLPAAPADVLDLGTGTGHVAVSLARLGYRVTGTDLSEPMLAQARAHAAALLPDPGAVTFAAGDAVAPHFAPGSFDAITNRYLMWTLREPDAALENWRRLLRPRGVLAIVDSTWFPAGLAASKPGYTDGESAFETLYDGDVRAALPVAEADSIDRTVELIRANGFPDTAVHPLVELRDLDREHGVAPGHEVQLQYMIVAHAA